MDLIIKLEHIHKVYHTGEVDVHAVRDVSLEIGPGEFVAIMGPSGSGKSSFMNLIGCLDHPTSGDYFLAGMPVSRLRPDDLADIRVSFREKLRRNRLHRALIIVTCDARAIPRIDCHHFIQLVRDQHDRPAFIAQFAEYTPQLVHFRRR